jgi:hypothetical protein
MWNDPIVEELHKHRQEMAAKFNYDVHLKLKRRARWTL